MEAQIAVESRVGRKRPSRPASPACLFRSFTAAETLREFIQGWKCDVREDAVDDGINRRTLHAYGPGYATGSPGRLPDLPRYAGVDWTVYFTNNGNRDTPVIEAGQGGSMP